MTDALKRAPHPGSRWLPLLAALLAVRFALALAWHPAYGFHRDEFLYFAMADHLDLFRMQFPPLIALVAGAGHALFGVSVWAARLPAALAGTALVALVLVLTRRLGGGTWALVFAALAMTAGPIWLRAAVLMQPVVFDQLWCAAAVAALLVLATGGSPWWWLAVGAALGLGALTKFSVAFYAAGILVAVLATPLRMQLRTPWPWAGALVAAVLAVPSITGQIVHGWPFLAQMRALQNSQLERVTATDFLVVQVLMLGAGSLIAVAGLAAALGGRTWRRAAVAGVFALAVLTAFLLLHGKAYYAAPIYPPLIAIGAVALERALDRHRLRLLRPALAALLLASAAVLFPIGVPALAPPEMARYAARLGVTHAVQTNHGATLPLPQDYADMIGWDRFVDTVAAAARRLSPDDRRRLVILADNYGEAGALELLGPSRGLPRPISLAGDFHAWGPGPLPGDVVLTVGIERSDLEPHFASIEHAAWFDDAWMVPEERYNTILLCRQPSQSLQAIWPRVGPNWD
jgi:4-amino-4-deoxy-L-arabinose transferase-like glycosyltransferase